METVLDILRSYPYFFTTIGGILAILLVTGIALGRDQRRTVVMSGVLLMPAFPAAAVFDYDYWSPARIGGRILGIEDLLFTFLAGAGAWLLATWPFRTRIITDLRLKPMLRRYATSMLIGLLIFFLLFSTNLDSMSSTLAIYGIWLVVLLFIKREFWQVALCGALTFGTVYPLLLKLVFFCWPHYLSQFSGHGIWSRKVAGLVVGEIFWGVGFGASWPLFLTFIYNAQWRVPPEETAEHPERAQAIHD